MAFRQYPRRFDLVRVICQGEAAKCNTRSGKNSQARRLSPPSKRSPAPTGGSRRRSINGTPTRGCSTRPTASSTCATGQSRQTDPRAYMTKITAVGPRGDCPLFLAFLDRIMGGDKALVAYLQRVFGYCLTGDTSEQALFFNYGGGANGKTVLMSTVSGILGDYCIATPIETFTESKSDRHPTELARLRGARLVTATETEAGRHWAESRLKELTGGENIAARFMHQNFFEYLPAVQARHLSGNHKPRLRSVGLAMRRRVNMIPFTVTIPEDERDPQLVEKLKAEWPGILQWMIDGCLDWQERGLAPPEAVTKATDAYFAGEDGFADWIADRCERSRASGRVRPSTVRLMAGLCGKGWATGRRHQAFPRGNGTAWLSAQAQQDRQLLCRPAHPPGPAGPLARTRPVKAGEGFSVNRRSRARETSKSADSLPPPRLGQHVPAPKRVDWNGPARLEKGRSATRNGQASRRRQLSIPRLCAGSRRTPTRRSWRRSMTPRPFR